MILQNVELTFNASNYSIDLSYLKEFSHGEKEFEKEMLESSKNEAEQKIQLLDRFIREKSYQKMKSTAHSLKSLMSVIGSASLYESFYLIEHYNEKAAPHDEINKLFNHTNQIWQNVKIVLQKMIIEIYMMNETNNGST